MKSGRSIQDVSREILRQQEAKADYLVATDRLHMDTWGDSPVIRVLDREGIDQIEPLEIQQTAHQQIGTYLDIPSKYYDRMLQRDPALLSYNVNRWFQKEPEQKLLRTMDGKARAFLSNRYRRIDNLDIARVVLPIIGEMEGARFESCEITDDRMYLKVVNPRLQAEVVPGDVVQAGIMISNSETGLGAVNIQPLIYRLVCSNGMVVNEAGTRRAHIGRVNTTDVNFALYSQQTLDAEDRAFVLKIQDTVRAAVDEARFSTVLERMRESKQAQLNTQDLPGLVKLAGSSFGILEEEGKGVLQHLIEDGDFTLYGLANAVTRFSQDVESYSRLFDTTTRRLIMQYTDNEAALIGGLISNYFLRPAVSAALKDSYTRVLEHLRTGRVSAADLKQVQKALAFLTPTCQMSREAQRDLMGASLKTTALLSSCR